MTEWKVLIQIPILSPFDTKVHDTSQPAGHKSA